MIAYDTSLPTCLYVYSSPFGTQATVAQKHLNDSGGHTSRRWTPAEAGYGQIERESNGILTEMYMNKMYVLGTEVEIITDHSY